MSADEVEPPAYVGWAIAAGLSLLVAAGALYISELSRAVGVVLAAVGCAVTFGAFAVNRRGAWPPRRWLLALAALLVALAGYGVWLLIYSANHPPVPV